MTWVWLVRHAPVTLPGICYGQSDIAVTVPPEEAARTVLTQWVETHAGGLTPHVWTSPWARTRDVAELVAAALGAPLRIDARLSELAFGEWEGRAYAELERDDAHRFARWMAAYATESPPGGETVEQLRLRVSSWLTDLRPEPPVLAFTHAGVMRTVRALCRNATYAAVAGESVEHLRLERVAER